jgi:hypothetical protein
MRIAEGSQPLRLQDVLFYRDRAPALVAAAFLGKRFWFSGLFSEPKIKRKLSTS